MVLLPSSSYLADHGVGALLGPVVVLLVARDALTPHAHIGRHRASDLPCSSTSTITSPA